MNTCTRCDAEINDGTGIHKSGTELLPMCPTCQGRYISEYVEREPSGFSGPLFHPSETSHYRSIYNKDGSHYNIFKIDRDSGMEALRELFGEDAECNDLNFVVFSTSGVHGTYTTIDEIEDGFTKHGSDFEFNEAEDGWPDGWHGRDLTVLVVQPRLVCMRYGEVRLRSLDDVEYVKKLRESTNRLFK